MTDEKENSALITLYKEFNFTLPKPLTDKKYQEIKKFNDFEYVYCIAYEMLIRTNEYNLLLKEYSDLVCCSQGEKQSKLNSLTTKIGKLGLNRNSFIGFDCEDINVFEKIKQYEEITNSPWSARKMDFNSNWRDVLWEDFITYYSTHNKFYRKKKTSEFKQINIDATNAVVQQFDLYILSNQEKSNTNNEVYKSLTGTIYLKDLDEDFIATIKEENKSLLTQIKPDFKINKSFWHQFYLGDIKNGLCRLAKYYMNNNEIRNLDNSIVDFNQYVKSSPIKFKVPCINLEKDNEVDLKTISNEISLQELEDDFLEELEFNDLKGGYIETEPIYSRPRLIFDEARLINLPINLNLSKEELLFYISQIKDEYDENKNIVKNSIEYLFDLTLESDNVKIPNEMIKFASRRKIFKNNLSSAFYVYDLYVQINQLFTKKKTKLEEQKGLEIKQAKEHYKNYTDKTNEENKIKAIEATFDHKLKDYEQENIKIMIHEYTGISTDKIGYYLSTLKEYIHGVNDRGESNSLKGKGSSKKYADINPKYKNLIIGSAYLIKSTKGDLINNLNL